MARTAAKDDGKSEPIPTDIQAMSFEQALAALDEIVQKLETGRVGLEESINIYTRGTFLRRHCEAKLTAAGERVEKIVVGADGSVAGVEPADIK